MDIENKTPKEIQEAIFAELAKGTNVDQLKTELRSKCLQTEGYYFIPEKEYSNIQAEVPTASSSMSGWKLFWSILTIIILIFRIARCASRM